MSAFWERVLSPYLLGLQIAPKVAFAPLFIMWLGYNAWPKLIVTLLSWLHGKSSEKFASLALYPGPAFGLCTSTLVAFCVVQ